MRAPRCLGSAAIVVIVSAEIKTRDRIPSDPVFLELLIEAYLEKYRKPPIVIPSEEELIEMFLAERDKRDE